MFFASPITWSIRAAARVLETSLFFIAPTTARCRLLLAIVRTLFSYRKTRQELPRTLEMGRIICWGLLSRRLLVCWRSPPPCWCSVGSGEGQSKEICDALAQSENECPVAPWNRRTLLHNCIRSGGKSRRWPSPGNKQIRSARRHRTSAKSGGRNGGSCLPCRIGLLHRLLLSTRQCAA